MAFDLIGKNPKHPLGIGFRLNIWKWIDLSAFLLNNEIISDEEFLEFTHNGGHFISPQRCAEISVEVLNKINFIGVNMSPFNKIHDELSKIPRVNDKDAFLFAVFLESCGGATIR